MSRWWSRCARCADRCRRNAATTRCPCATAGPGCARTGADATPLLPDELAGGRGAGALGSGEQRALGVGRATGGRRAWATAASRGTELGVVAGVDVEHSAAGQNARGGSTRQTEGSRLELCLPPPTAQLLNAIALPSVCLSIEKRISFVIMIEHFLASQSMNDTIAAISTPIGLGGIAIIRISGPQAFEIADQIFFSVHGKPSQFTSHTIHYGRIIENGTTIDEVMLTILRAPRTYTAEDTVEINCHGGMITAKSILNLCLKHGARLAEPGEFTKRAFLNGRIDLTQAEAVMDLIQARTERAQIVAAHALEGRLLIRIEETYNRLSKIVAHLEAHLDFPEEDIPPAARDQLVFNLQDIIESLQDLLTTADKGQILREGVQVVIIGRPNVGKSSLMNALLGKDRSIVTPLPGTTRDTVEATLDINGIPIQLIDTAGFRKTTGLAESFGIERSHKAVSISQLVLHVLDISKPYNDAELELRNLYLKKPVIYVFNKVDKKQKFVPPTYFDITESVKISAINGTGINELKEKISKLIWHGKVGEHESDIAINSRHSICLSSTINNISQGINMLNSGESNELISHCLRIGLNSLGEITGKNATEDIITQIFSRFCIGK